MLSIGDPFASRRRQTRPSDRIDPGPPTSPWSRLSPMRLSFQQRRTPEVRAFQRPSNPSRAKHSAKNAGKTERLCVGVRTRLASDISATTSPQESLHPTLLSFDFLAVGQLEKSRAH